MYIYIYTFWSQWVCGLRLGSVAARLLGLRVRIPLGTWMSLVNIVFCQVERYLRQADHSSRGVLPSVVCVIVIVIAKPQSWGGSDPLAGLLRHEHTHTHTHAHTHTHIIYKPQSSESKLWSLFENVAGTFILLTLCLFIYFRNWQVSVLPSILQNMSSVFAFSFLKIFPFVVIILPNAYILNMLSIIHYHSARVNEITFRIKFLFSHLSTHLIIYVTF